MNTEDIERALKNCKPGFLGVFSKDTLPEDEPHGTMVVNTDPESEPGTHWIAMNVEKGRGEYFDSFGRPPEKTFRSYLKKHCGRGGGKKDWTFNERQLQSVASRFCGHYCVYYCLLKNRGLEMEEIVSKFTNDTGFNDVLVHGFVCRNFY